MTTTSPAIPAWINAEAIVDPELKRQAESLAARFNTVYDELVPFCREAIMVSKQLSASETEQTSALDSVMRNAEEAIRIEVADASWKIFHELNGAGPLYRALGALQELFRITADSEDAADLDEPTETEVSK